MLRNKMIESAELKKYLDFAYEAYQNNNVSGQAYRQKGNVPFIMHPLWCASMLITDTQVPQDEREIGFKALILHDVLEDTSLELPEWVELEVKETVQKLTFENWDEALKIIPTYEPFLKLLLVYDSLSSMYENHVSDLHRAGWIKTTKYLLEEVEKEYGNVRIVQVGKAILENTDWAKGIERRGVSILFVNNKEEVLLFLRDDIPTIICPGCWDVPGGHVEENEEPEDCIVREMKEEIEIDIGRPELFKMSDLPGRTEYTFWKRVDFDVDKINLHEGQGMKWFSEEAVKNLPEEKILIGFKPVILDFFKERPFDK